MEEDDDLPTRPELTPLEGHDLMDVEEQQPDPLGGWYPRVAINRRAMESLLQATSPKRIGKVEGPYSREPDRSKLRTDFGDDSWEEIFPDNPPTKHPWQQNGSQINWDNWDLESGRPGTGSSARELLARLEKHTRRCWNPECSSAATGVVGSDIITADNRHDYWDPAWTRRTGIGTGLPWYNAARSKENVPIVSSCNHGYQGSVDNGNGDQTMYEHDASAASTEADADDSSHGRRHDVSPTRESSVNVECPVTPTKRNIKKKGAATTSKTSRVRHDLEAQSDDEPNTETGNNANPENNTPTASSKMSSTPLTVTPMKRRSSRKDLEGQMKRMKMDGYEADDPFW